MKAEHSLLSFQGRIRRGRFIAIFAGATVASLLVSTAAVFLLPDSAARLVLLGCFLSAAWVQFAAGAKRSRDAGQSPWFAVLMLPPLIGLLAIAYLACRRGKDTPPGAAYELASAGAENPEKRTGAAT